MTRKLFFVLALAVILLIVSPIYAQQRQFVFGVILIGPRNDQGWSQAHFEAGRYVESTVAGTRMVFAENVADTDLANVVTDLANQGAQVIFVTSEEYSAEINQIAIQEDFSEIVFIHVSGDDVLTGTAPANVGNLMGQMEWGKMIAGCAAALATQTGSIGYIGSINNFETRRFASSTFLGAQYCYNTYRADHDQELNFTVTWIGYWFFIPDSNVLNPVDVANEYFDNNADVIISGIDTPQALQIAGERAEDGEAVWAIPYDFADACLVSPDVCLGVPYFHWGPAYSRLVTAVREQTWTQSWDWIPPTWSDILSAEESIIGFQKGDALSEDMNASLDDFIATLTSYAENPFVPPSFALWRGPLTLLNGTELAPNDEIVSPLDIWYLPDLLQGMLVSNNSR